MDMHMDVELEDLLLTYPVPRRPITVAEYHRMAEVGIFHEDDRVELLEGQLVAMTPIGWRHALAVDALNVILITAMVGRARVRVQNPVTLDGISELHPDFAVVSQTWPGYPTNHPAPPDIFALIEVSDSTVNIDSGAKLAKYARSGIREYWIVDLVKSVVRVHREPSGGEVWGHHDGQAVRAPQYRISPRGDVLGGGCLYLSWCMNVGAGGRLQPAHATRAGQSGEHNLTAFLAVGRRVLTRIRRDAFGSRINRDNQDRFLVSRETNFPATSSIRSQTSVFLKNTFLSLLVRHYPLLIRVKIALPVSANTSPTSLRLPLSSAWQRSHPIALSTRVKWVRAAER